MRSTDSSGLGWFRDLSRVFLLVCLVVFCLFLWVSFQIEEMSSYLLPRVLAGLGIALTSIHLGAEYARSSAPTTAAADEGKGISVFVAIGFAAAYFLLVPLLGFVLATALAIVAFSYVTGFSRKKLVTILAIVIPAVLHLTFVELLKAPLPGGLLGAIPF